MSLYLIVATDHGLVVCEADGAHWRPVHRGLERNPLTSVIAREGVILAGSRQGIFRSDDLGQNWVPASDGLSISHVRWLAYHPEISDFELAGTEPAAIFVSRDGSGHWRSCEEVEQMREQYGWRLPYSPEAGCVRGFAVQSSRAYAAVEDGCVLISDDGGEHWRLAEGSRGHLDHRPASGFIHSDVHSITVHPSSSDLVYAPTGGGFYVSQDGAKTWELLYSCYVRAVWIDPDDAQHMILGPADGVDWNGRIEETRDGGRTWQHAARGLTAPWRNHMVERFTQVGERLLAVLSNGELIETALEELNWEPVLNDLHGVNAVTTLEV